AVAHQAADAWRRITQKQVCRGQVRMGLAAVCLYFECKLAGVPRSKETIVNGCGVPLDAFRKAARLYRLQESATQLEVPTDSKDVLSDCMLRLGALVPENLQRRVAACARVADEHITRLGVLEGRTPVVRAAAAISLAMEKVKLKGCGELHRHLDVSQYTLSRALNLIQRHTTKALGC
ncbi:MAG: hypothetical protein EOO40_02400, partial [Deltaproteobacteria bacterium]